MSSVLAPIIGAASVSRLVQYSDAWKGIENRLKLVTASAEGLAHVSGRVYDIAQDTRSDLAATATLYQRLTFATKGLGVTQEEILKFSEQLNKQLLVGGLNSEEAAASVYQLTQAFNKGKLDGDEFRTILESAPPILEALQNSLKKTRGEILQMSADGKLGPRVLIDAVNNMSQVTDDRFAKLSMTISQAFTLVENAFTRFVGQSEDVNGVAGVIADSLAAIAENMDEVGRVALALAAVITTRLAIGFGVALTAINPWAAALTALIGTTVYLTSATDDLTDSMSRVSKIRPPTVDTATTGPEARQKISEALVARGLKPLPEEKDPTPPPSLSKAEQKKLENARQALADYNTQLKRQYELLQLTPREQAAVEAKYKTLELAEKAGVKNKEELVQANMELARSNYDLNDSMQESVRFMQELKDRSTSALTDIAFSFDSASGSALQFAEAIARIAFEKKIAGPLVDGLFGSGGNPGIVDSLLDGFGGFFADGGSPPVGRPSIVGERGPEVFVPRSAGTIVPNHSLGGSQVIVQQTINLSPGLPETVNAAIARAAPAIAAQAQTAVFQAIERGGTEARIVGRRN